MRALWTFSRIVIVGSRTNQVLSLSFRAGMLGWRAPLCIGSWHFIMLSCVRSEFLELNGREMILTLLHSIAVLGLWSPRACIW